MQLFVHQQIFHPYFEEVGDVECDLRISFLPGIVPANWTPHTTSKDKTIITTIQQNLGPYQLWVEFFPTTFYKYGSTSLNVLSLCT